MGHVISNKNNNNSHVFSFDNINGCLAWMLLCVGSVGCGVWWVWWCGGCGPGV
jgi:hypothetical protein